MQEQPMNQGSNFGSNPLQQPTPNQHSAEWFKARKRFFIALVTWLLSLPLAVMVSLIVRVLFGVDGVIVTLSNLLSLLLGLYAFLGWVIVLVLGITWGNKK